MNYSDNECSPQETRNYRGEVTSLYRNGPTAFNVGLNGIRNGIVT
jgi:hypothetical protein